jgi:hypothetical protein
MKSHYKVRSSVSKKLASLGHEAHEMIGKNFASIIHKDDKQKWFDF